MPAYGGDALLGFLLVSGLGLRGEREDSCLLAFTEPRQQYDLAIGGLERVMIVWWRLPDEYNGLTIGPSWRVVGHRWLGRVEKLNKEINAVLADPTMEARFANFGYTAFASSPAGFGKFIAEDIEKWAKVVKFAGIKPE